MSNIQKILLIFGILIIIVSLEIFVSTTTNKLLDNTTTKLEELKKALNEENYEESKTKSENISKEWNEYTEKLSFFTEHDEVEKIGTKIAVILENTRNKNYILALEDVMEAQYLIEHVKDKNKIKLKNVF